MIKEPIKRHVESGLEQEVLSPMDPPEPGDLAQVDEETRRLFSEPLQVLMTEHDVSLQILQKFEKSLQDLETHDWNLQKIDTAPVKAFFFHMDQDMLMHQRKEEKWLFPRLESCLIEAGECSQTRPQFNPIMVMEEEHLRAMQVSCLVFNLFGLAPRLEDAKARVQVMKHAVHQAKDLVELLKLHIFRENNVLFPLAHQHFKPADWEEITGFFSCG